MKNTLDIFKWYAKAHPAAVIAVMVASLFWAITWPASPYLLGIIVDTIQQTSPVLVVGENTQSPTWLNFQCWHIGWPVVAIIVINFMRNVVYYTIDLSFAKSIPSAKASLIDRLYRYLLGQSYGYFENQYSGQLANKIANATDGLESAIGLLNFNIASLLALLISGGLLAMVSPFFTLVFWLWALTISVYSYRNAVKGGALAKTFAQASSNLQGEMVDALSNMTTIVVDASGLAEQQRLANFINHYQTDDVVLKKHYYRARFGHGFLTTLFISIMLIGLVIGFYQQKVTAGDFAFILSLSWGMGGLVHDLGKQFLDLSQHLGTLAQGMSILQAPQLLSDKADAKEIMIQKGQIKIDNISFGYHDNLVIENLCLDINPGEKMGIVGRSGCGKTTLLKLLLRLYEVQRGSIIIDGYPINTVTQASLRHQIVLVPQDISLFHRTIAENICHGMQGASMQDIILAAKRAHIHDFILSLPGAYDTLVGQRGVKISGGQRQRIAIARAFLKNPPIVLLDEATSALDSQTESAIQESLNTLMQGRTTIVVAHRLSTLVAMDRIIVIDKGHIMEQGDHQTLLAAKGLYAQLWEKQQDGFIA